MATSILELRHLRTLLALKEAGTISRAAQLLNVTQSALSHQIKLLEDRYGQPLFERKSVPPQFTAVGERLLALAGGSKASILSVQVWLADMKDFAAMNAVYDAWVDKANLPARATGESRLATPDYLVEFIVTAAKI
mgnify:CR=1 FL=1